MCGIAGFFVFPSGTLPDWTNEDLLHRMLNHLNHRGPDDEGVVISSDNCVGLGNRRLSIIDLSTGHQPISNEDNTVQIVFNGEIYNYQDLWRGLHTRGHIFKTKNSDTEVVLHLYEEMGIDCLSLLNGMFALAIWDMRTGTLWLARDRIGKKPLYFTEVDGVLLFASEVKSLFECKYVSRVLESDSLVDYFVYRSVLAPNTLFKGIYKLRAGHWIRCSPSGIEPQTCYWHLDADSVSEEPLTESMAVRKIKDLLSDAVRLRLVSDVPVAAFLSGGIDSSVIVALMSQFYSGRIETYSVGFADSRYSELPYARLVAEKYSTVHHEIIVGPEDFSAFLPKMAYFLDEPITDPSLIALYYLSASVHQHGLKVVLSGEGSDELFAGYGSYQAFEKYYDLFRTLNLLPRTLVRNLSSLSGSVRVKDVLDRIAVGQIPFPGTAWPWTMNEIIALLKNCPAPSTTRDSWPKFTNRIDNGDFLNRMMAFDLMTRIPDDILNRTDRVTMANSLEARTPFLDYRLIEFAMRLPGKWKLNKGITKYILKRAIGDLLPDEVVNRSKVGFDTPLGEWLRGPLSGLITDFTEWNFYGPHLFDDSVVSTYVESHFAGKNDHTAKLWGLIVLQHWHSYWIEHDATELTNSAHS